MKVVASTYPPSRYHHIAPHHPSLLLSTACSPRDLSLLKRSTITTLHHESCARTKVGGVQVLASGLWIERDKSGEGGYHRERETESENVRVDKDDKTRERKFQSVVETDIYIG